MYEACAVTVTLYARSKYALLEETEDLVSVVLHDETKCQDNHDNCTLCMAILTGHWNVLQASGVHSQCHPCTSRYCILHNCKGSALAIGAL